MGEREYPIYPLSKRKLAQVKKLNTLLKLCARETAFISTSIANHTGEEFMLFTWFYRCDGIVERGDDEPFRDINALTARVNEFLTSEMVA